MMLSSQISLRGGISLLNQAIQWWLGELVAILNLFRHFKSDNRLEFEVSNKHGLSLKDQDKLMPAAGLQNIALNFSDNAVLYRKIKLPVAAGKNIEKVVGYEFYKYFPVNFDDAMVSFSITQAGSSTDSLEVEIWAISKTVVDGYLSMIRQQYNIEVRTLTISNSDGIVLISEDVLKTQRSNRNHETAWSRRALNFGIFLLLLALLSYPVIKLDGLAEDLEQNISLLEKKAKPIIEVRDKIREVEKRFQYLVSKKKQNPDQAYIWSKVTATVSAKAILDRMLINGRVVQLEGKAPSVERLIKTLESDSGISEVKIIGPVTTTNDNLYETMKISMTVNQ